MPSAISLKYYFNIMDYLVYIFPKVVSIIQTIKQKVNFD